MTIETTGDPRRDRIADELEGAGYPDIAADVAGGEDIEHIVADLRAHDHDFTEAIEILTWRPS